MENITLSIRPAVEADIAVITKLMGAAIAELQKGFLSPAEIEASKEVMGLDTQIIADRTYFVVETAGRIVGCGGWSRRKTLFGGDHSAGRDAALLDPETEAAKIRAMYTDPAYVRQGVGRLVLRTCEDAAAAEGFSRLEMGATLAGVPLYEAAGYRKVALIPAKTKSGVEVPIWRMEKAIAAPSA